MTESVPSSESPAPASRWRRLRPARWWIAPGLALLVGLYYAVGVWTTDVIDANPEFGPGTVTPRQSRSVAMAAALILREVDVHGWTANDPFFQPGWLLDDMPRYQEGIVAALGHFVDGLAARQGDALPPGFDGDPRFAAGLLKYPGTIWKFASATSWMPTASAEKQYRRAAVTLQAYNARLEQGTLAFDRSPQALTATLADMAADLGGSSGAIEADVAARRWPLNARSEELFYTTKGRLYASSLLLRELGWDYAQVVNDRNLGGAWRQLLDTLRTASAMAPWLVVNAAPGSTLLPSQLAVQGFYLLRARDQLDAIIDQIKTPAP